jgi:hypothetical protein
VHGQPTSPTAERVVEDVSEPVLDAEPAAESEAEPAVEPVAEPKPEPAAEPVAEPPPPPAPAPARPRPGPKPAPVSMAKQRPAPPAQRPQQLSAEWLSAGVLSVAALAFAILIAIFSISGGGGDASKKRNQIREQVLAAAKTCTARENTYSYKTLDADETAALACTTGEFHTQVKQTFDKVLIPKAPGQQQVQQTQIDLAAVERISEDGSEWTILVFGQTSVTNSTTGTSSPRLDPFAAVVRMKKTGSKWLISYLDYA